MRTLRYRLFPALVSAALLSLTACKAADEPMDSRVGADAGSPAAGTDSAHTREIEAWRQERLANLTSEDGWLTLTGLYWLRDGPNAVGSAVSSPVRLPSSAPDRVGLLKKSGSAVMLQLDSGVEARLEPETAARQLAESTNGRSVLLVNDTSGEPTVVHLGSVSFHVIQRDDRLGVRVKDAQNPLRTEFAGIESFPISEDWVVDARFEPYDPPKDVPIVNVLGQVTPNPSPGALVFEHGGATHRLDALDAEDELFVIFGDRTNGETTYPAGRYLYVPKPAADKGTVRVDFNRAYNPPCAFTEFATCPLPPPQNKLEVAIEAGEQYEKHGDTDPAETPTAAASDTSDG